MYTIGILTKDPVWEEKLATFAESSNFSISGSFWTNAADGPEYGRVFELSDIIWIPEWSEGNLEIAVKAIKQSKHVLFGFPLSRFPDDACALVELAKESRVKIQVGHHEHFNPAFRTVYEMTSQVQFIELRHNIGLCGDDYIHKLFHALITDIDLCLSLVPDSLKKFQSHATYIYDTTPPIINIRLGFNNGTVANLRIDPYTSGNSIKMSVFQKAMILRADLLNGTASVENFRNGGLTGPGELTSLLPLEHMAGFRFDENDPDLKTSECLHFMDCLNRDLSPVSSLEKGCEALKIARDIFGKVSVHGY